MFRSYLIGLALAASVLFNVFFAAGYFQAKARSDAGVPPADRVAEELELDTKQAESFDELRRRMERESRDLRASSALVHTDLIREFTKETADPAVIEDLIARDAELHHQHRVASLERLRDFVADLSPEQKNEFLHKMVERDRRHRERMKFLLEKFDRDGDGKLDRDERAAAEEHHRQRREQFHRRGDRDGRGRSDRQRGGRIDLMRKYFDLDGNDRLDPDERLRVHEQFDTDRDGWLSEDEQRAIHRWIREQEMNGGSSAGNGV